MLGSEDQKAALVTGDAQPTHTEAAGARSTALYVAGFRALAACLGEGRLTIGVTVALCTALGILWSVILPTYEATAVMVVTFDRIRPVASTGPTVVSISRLVLSLSKSDSVLNELLTSPRLMQYGRSLDWLRDHLAARSTSDPSVVALTVQSNSPDESLATVEVWSELIIEHTRGVYSRGSTQNTEFMKAQLANANDDVRRLSDERVAFDRRDESAVITTLITSLTRDQGEYEREQAEISRILPNLDRMSAGLATRSDDSRVTVADELVLLSLQLRAYGTRSDAPAQLQISEGSGLSTRTVADARRQSAEIRTTLQGQAAEAQAQVIAIRTKILALQGQRTALQSESEDINQRLARAKETRGLLAQQYDDAKLEGESPRSIIQLAGVPRLPLEPVVPRWLVALAGAIAGAVLSVSWLVLRVWLRTEMGSKTERALLS